MENETKHLRIYGKVQGVGYRHWCSQMAKRLGLTGWVRNVSHDHSVEAVITGYPDAIQKFVTECYNGPSTSKVDIVHVTQGVDEELKTFEIRETSNR